MSGKKMEAEGFLSTYILKHENIGGSDSQKHKKDG